MVDSSRYILPTFLDHMQNCTLRNCAPFPCCYDNQCTAEFKNKIKCRPKTIYLTKSIFPTLAVPMRRRILGSYFFYLTWPVIVNRPWVACLIYWNYVFQEAMLKTELRNMERSQKREGIDMTYLKNVILKLLETGIWNFYCCWLTDDMEHWFDFLYHRGSGGLATCGCDATTVQPWRGKTCNFLYIKPFILVLIGF
jgi:hypothetical protein